MRHENEDSESLRLEMISLLRAQMQALNTLSGLTDKELAACYARQERVRELRDRLTQANQLAESVT